MKPTVWCAQWILPAYENLPSYLVHCQPWQLSSMLWSLSLPLWRMVAFVVLLDVRLHPWLYSDKDSGAVLSVSLLGHFVASLQIRIQDGWNHALDFYQCSTHFFILAVHLSMVMVHLHFSDATLATHSMIKSQRLFLDFFLLVSNFKLCQTGQIANWSFLFKRSFLVEFIILS